MADKERLCEVLEPLVQTIAVGYNTNLIQLEIDGIPAFRPVENPMREKLGTLFTLLFNAKTVLDSARAAKASRDEENK